MNFRSPKREELDGRQLPESIYASVVNSLYRDTQSLLIGISCAAAAPIIAYFKTDDPFQLVFTGIFVAIGVFRVILSMSFFRYCEGERTPAGDQKWENWYAYVGAAFVSCLGLWYIASVYRSNDPFVETFALVLSIAHLTGLIGRNFSSAKVIQYQSIILSGFLITGTLLIGGVFYAALAAFMVPFLIAVRTMCKRLREMLFYAELNALDNRVIADRFDVALDNVTHGLAMFDDKGKVVVANSRFTELVGLGDWEIIDCNISVLTAARIRDAEENTLAAEIADCLKSQETRRFTFEIASGQIIEADFSPMPVGGVILLSDVSERVKSQQAILELANFDPLTNLPNRRHFIEEIRWSMQNANNVLKPCAMFFIDLDKFKEVNDTLGHAVGDKLLKTIAARLQAVIRPGGLTCRFGGDEFVVIIPGMTGHDECSAFANRVITELSLPVLIDNNQINVGASVGIAIAPEDASEAELLLQYADAALYEAKAKGRGTHVFFNNALGDAIRVRRELEIDLGKAIEEGTLDLHYQPIINLRRGGVTSCEALVRWNHPVHGQISPAKFIPIAEESGLIVELGKYVLRKAMKDCLSWQTNTRVAVNVSTIQFHKSDVHSIVCGLLSETGLHPSNLEIEITESAMMDNIEEVSRTLNALAETGVRISLDDFGTGFSNLSYLHALPFHKVKIDRCFIENAMANERSLVLLKGVVDLINRLQLRVVLEGIENEDQIGLLSDQVKVDEVQGFLFGRPMPSRDIATLLHSLDAPSRDRPELQSA